MPDDALRVAEAWATLDTVMDPEIPVISIRDLGIVRAVTIGPDRLLKVVLTPTYCGCPAVDAITADARRALVAADIGPVRVTLALDPAWTTDWITPEGRRKLRAEGIVPPQGPRREASDGCTACKANGRGSMPPALECPRCGSATTQQLSAFGATACKSLYRCLSCREPFEYFKPI